MKDRNAIPLKRTGCLALSRVHGGGPGGGPAMPRSCAAVPRKGTKPLPHPLPAVGGRGGRAALVYGGERKVGPFLGKRVLPLASVFWVALVTWAQGAERGGKVCCSVCGGFDSF